MSVITYLQDRAKAAVLSGAEETSINTSISTIKSRLTSHFGNGLSEQFRFGSSTRGTILPRSMDEHSDIDYRRICELAPLIVDTRNALSADLRNGSNAKIVRL